MNRHVRAWATAAAVVVGIWLVSAAGSGQAAADDAEAKQAREATLKVADLIAKKNYGAATTEAKAAAKKVDDLEKVMTTLKLRSQGGVGVGPKPGALTPDGIEAKLINMGRRALPEKDLNTQAAALTQAADILAAVAEIAIAKGPPKVGGKKKPEDWATWSKDMRDAALGMRGAVEQKKPAEVKDWVVKLNTSCNNCHAIWKDQ
jgi:hypothetical protein